MITEVVRDTVPTLDHSRRLSMKLIFVNRFFHPDHSATSQLLTRVATSLAARGWDVHVVTSRQRYDAADACLPARETFETVQVHRVWTSRFGRGRFSGRVLDYLTFYSSAAWCLWRLTHRDDIVVAKTDPPMLSVVTAAVATLRGARLVNWLQDVFPEIATALRVRGINAVTERLLRHLRDWSLFRADANVVLGERMRAHVEGLGVNPSRIKVVPNWECGRTIRPIAREANKLRHEWGLADKFVVGYSGNMGRAHEFGIVLDAAERLKDRRDIVFLWIGDGAQRWWLKREALRRRLIRFVFQPYQPRERLAESLSVPDVHLISLRPELEGLIFPSKFYGIAAAGRPSLFIGDPNGDVAAELRKHQCGYNVAPGDSDALVARIEALSADLKTCRQMGMRARQAFLMFYHEPFAIDRWNGLLRNVAGLAPSAVTNEAAAQLLATHKKDLAIIPAKAGIQ
jgi:colanic acid biosynthesis glycosyl transferase WcaI